jgi:hypothetical protein
MPGNSIHCNSGVMSTRRNGDGSARLKAAICSLLGETPASEQLTELKTALGDSINLAATLAQSLTDHEVQENVMSDLH